MAMNQPPPPLNVHPSEDELKLVYQQISTGYHNIEDFRSRLLGFLPFLTGSSFFITIITSSNSKASSNLYLPLGFFGAIVTIGLMFYELENISRSEALIYSVYQLELKMDIHHGFFLAMAASSSSRLSAPFFPRFVNDFHAADLIYCTNIAAWVCLALWFDLPQIGAVHVAVFVALVLLLLLVVFVVPFMGWLRRRIHLNAPDKYALFRSVPARNASSNW